MASASVDERSSFDSDIAYEASAEGWCKKWLENTENYEKARDYNEMIEVQSPSIMNSSHCLMEALQTSLLAEKYVLPKETTLWKKKIPLQFLQDSKFEEFKL